MKLSILQENLSYGLAVVSRSVSTKAALPVLSNVLLSTEDGRLRLSGTNLEMGITLWLGAKVEKEGSITVPARVLLDFISTLPAGKVELDASDTILKVVSGSYDADINGIAAVEFPPIPTSGKGVTINLPGEVFASAVSQVAFAAATDEGRPVLTGVLTLIADNTLQLVATDGYRLSVKKVKLGYSIDKDLKLILPAKTLLEVAKIVFDESRKKGKDEKENGDLQISILSENKQVVFRVGNIELVSRIIEGQFPNYEKIIPNSFTTRAIVGKEEFLKATKIASIFARDSANIIRVDFNPKSEHPQTLSANAAGVGEQKSFVESSVEGEKNQIAFNARYLMDFLSNLTAGQLNLEISGALNPGVFKPVGDDSFLHVIMPVRVSE